jgi:hypothetical protein
MLQSTGCDISSVEPNHSYGKESGSSEGGQKGSNTEFEGKTGGKTLETGRSEKTLLHPFLMRRASAEWV